MMNDRFDRQVRFFGLEGQERLAAAHVAVVGVGGLGSHVVQQLAFLGVGTILLIDAQELDLTNRNRLVSTREDDSIPGTSKVDIAERTAKAIDSSIVVDKVFDSFVSGRGFAALIGVLVERRVGPVRLFINLENLTDVRQSQWDPLLRPGRAVDGRWTVDAWAPLDGRVINGGVRVPF